MKVYMKINGMLLIKALRHFWPQNYDLLHVKLYQ